MDVFLWMFFTSKRLVREINRLLNKEIHRTRKEINSLLSKGMSNIHLNATIKKN